MSTSTNTTAKVTTSLRSHLRSLANKRKSRVVTADDAQKFLTGKVGPSARISVINSALMSGDFSKTGNMTPSQRPAAKGRAITEWTLA